MDPPKFINVVCNSKLLIFLNYFNIIRKFYKLSMTPKISKIGKVLHVMIMWNKKIIMKIVTYFILMARCHYLLEKMNVFTNS